MYNEEYFLSLIWEKIVQFQRAWLKLITFTDMHGILTRHRKFVRFSTLNRFPVGCYAHKKYNKITKFGYSDETLGAEKNDA